MAAKPKPTASVIPSHWSAAASASPPSAQAGPGPSGAAANPAPAKQNQQSPPPAKAADQKAGSAAAAKPQPQVAASAKPAANAKWNCSVCTLENEASANVCGVCGADRSGAGASEGELYSELEFFPTFHDNKHEPLITPAMVERLYPQLPPSLRVCDLKLLYGLSQHGASLETMYRNVIGKGPTLLVVKDDKQHVFGAFLGDPWQPPRNDYYGNGLSFVMKLAPAAQPVFYKWNELKSTNAFYHLGKDEMIAVGGGDGFAIAIGKGLREGSSKACGTFNSPMLSGAAEYKVHALEVWGFIPSNHANG